jgi:hypothetical protein
MGTPDRQYGRELATEPEVDAKIAEHASATLLHEIDQSGTVDVVRDANGRVQLVRVRTGVLSSVIRETEVERDANQRVSAVVDRQYSPPARQRTINISRDNQSRFAGGTLTVT